MTTATQGTRPLTAAEVAHMLGVTPKTVSRWADGGKLRHFRTPGGHRRFAVEEIVGLRASLTEEAN